RPTHAAGRRARHRSRAAPVPAPVAGDGRRATPGPDHRRPPRAGDPRGAPPRLGAPRLRQRGARGPRVRRRRRSCSPTRAADGRGAARAGPRDPPGASSGISRRRVGGASLVVLASLALAGLLGLATGPAPISPAAVAATLVGRAPSELAATVVLELRLPRVLLAALAGGGLAGAGGAVPGPAANPPPRPPAPGGAGAAGRPARGSHRSRRSV